MAFRFLILPIAALLIGLCVNTVHPRGVRWSAETPTASQAGSAHSAPQNKQPAAQPRDPEGMTLAEARAWMARERVVLIDARAVAAYKAGHIPGAISLPEPEIKTELAAFEKRYDVKTPLLIYCESDECPLAIDLTYFLINERGYQNVRFLTGGYDEWLEQGAQPLDAGEKK